MFYLAAQNLVTRNNSRLENKIFEYIQSVKKTRDMS